MAITAKPLIPATVVPTAYAAQYTVPANVSTQIKKMTVNNTTAASIVVQLWLLGSGVAQSASNQLLQRSIAPNTVSEIVEAEGHILATGGTIGSSASAPGLSLIASGLEITSA